MHVDYICDNMYNVMTSRSATMVASRWMAEMQSRGAERLWLPSWQDKQYALHWLFLPGPTPPTGPRRLGLGQLMGFRAESVTGENRKQGFRVIVSLWGGTHSILECVWCQGQTEINK